MVRHFAAVLSSNNQWIICDIDDLPIISDKKWRIDSNGYAVHSFKYNGRCKRLYMHRLFLSPEKGKYVVDHINQNRADNRRSNLRIASYALNRWNSSNRRKGVIFLPRFGKWSARLLVKGTMLRLGRYENKAYAEHAYLKAVERYYG